MAHRRKSSLIPIILCVPLGLLAAAAERAVYLALPVSAAELEFLRLYLAPEDLANELLAGGLLTLHSAGPQAMALLSGTLGVCGGLWALSSVVGLLFRRRWALAAVRTGYAAVLVGALVGCGVAAVAVNEAASQYEQFDPENQGLATETFLLFWSYARWALAAAAGAVWMLILSCRGRALALYCPPPSPSRAPGDELIENLRTGGRDPRYRRSLLTSGFALWFLIVALPFLLLFRGCVEPYRVPYGSGQARVMRVMRVVRRQKKKRKRFILRRNAAIYWDIPDLRESDIERQVDEDTQLTHVADRNAVHGQMGAGGGKKGGWPDGVPGGRIRFIRLEYRGRDWDDGMDAHSRADINFLTFLRQEVPFPVARKGESHAVRLLARYPKGLAPPFVYLTGSDSVYVSRSDRRILREYLLEGGMLFADAGSWRWDRSFRGLMKSVFPDKRLIDIADDDEIYQMPYVFANGAPPLWHHGGFRAMGIKHKGRWVVFYHPGDINDAWKTGHSGMDGEIADKAFQMGINVMYYAITKYLELTRKYRKR